MTEDHKRLLAVFDVRVRDLMEFCDRQKEKINELESSLAQKEGELQQGEMKSARMRLSKLVREVDKCIALLNE